MRRRPSRLPRITRTSSSLVHLVVKIRRAASSNSLRRGSSKARRVAKAVILMRKMAAREAARNLCPVARRIRS